MKATCGTCFRCCVLDDGQIGFCRARVNRGGSVVPLYYNVNRTQGGPSTHGCMLSAIALDPIEKKPLARFMPGSRILSVGGWGCNLRCAFCQNHEISQRGPELDDVTKLDEDPEAGGLVLSPEQLAAQALSLQKRGNIGVAYTYNEPLVAWEYVRDCAKLIHQAGMKNVIVTNGSVLPSVLEELLPYTDAMNIDLKCFSADSYRKLGGDQKTVKEAITICHTRCHVELTTLVVPDFNDSEEEMAEEAAWIASLDRNIPLHLTRFFPRWQMEGRPPTPVESLSRLASLARRELTAVLLGNV